MVSSPHKSRRGIGCCLLSLLVLASPSPPAAMSSNFKQIQGSTFAVEGAVDAGELSHRRPILLTSHASQTPSPSSPPRLPRVSTSAPTPMVTLEPLVASPTSRRHSRALSTPHWCSPPLPSSPEPVLRPVSRRSPPTRWRSTLSPAPPWSCASPAAEPGPCCQPTER